MTNETHRARTERKRAEAEQRQAAYDSMTLSQKIAQAKKRGGVDSREYKRLIAQRGA